MVSPATVCHDDPSGDRRAFWVASGMYSQIRFGDPRCPPHPRGLPHSLGLTRQSLFDIPDGGASIPRCIDSPGAVDVTLLN